MTSDTDPLPPVLAALALERRLLEELETALADQRAGVAADSPAAIESANHQVSRVVRTLDAARLRREQLIAALPAGNPPSPEIDAGRAALRAAAVTTVQSLTLNQKILRHALKAGDRYLQALFSRANEPLPAYAVLPAAPSAPRGVVVNRSA